MAIPSLHNDTKNRAINAVLLGRFMYRLRFLRLPPTGKNRRRRRVSYSGVFTPVLEPGGTQDLLGSYSVCKQVDFNCTTADSYRDMNATNGVCRA